MREYGVGGEIIGALMSAMGIFLPGTFLIFFVIRFWDSLKKYRAVRASLEGITAASSGLVLASAVILFQPLENTFLNFAFTIATFALLLFTKIPSPLIILGGLILAEWPYSGLWIIGLFVGIDLIIAGWTWIVVSLAAKKLANR